MNEFAKYVKGAWFPIAVMFVICILVLYFGMRTTGIIGNNGTTAGRDSAKKYHEVLNETCVRVYLPETHRTMVFCPPR